MGLETVYLCHDLFSKADEIAIRTNPERGTLQQTSWGLEEVSLMSASRFLLPTVYPEGGTQKLTSYFSICGHWNLFISGQLLERFLGDLMKLSSLDTMRNPSLKSKSRQHVSQYRISRQSLRKCLGLRSAISERTLLLYIQIQTSRWSFLWRDTYFLIWYILFKTSPSDNQAELCFKMTP